MEVWLIPVANSSKKSLELRRDIEKGGNSIPVIRIFSLVLLLDFVCQVVPFLLLSQRHSSPDFTGDTG